MFESLVILAQSGADAAAGAGEETPLVDWITVAAQIVNFLVLLGLLYWLLYGRVVRAMDQREENIANRFQQAEQRETEATQERDKLQSEREDLEQARQQKLDEAQHEAADKREQLLDEARQEVDEKAERWRDQLRRQQRSVGRELREQVAREVCRISRRTLSDLADTDLQHRMAAVLTQRLSDLPDERRRQLRDAVTEAEGSLEVTTPWELPEDDRERIANTLRSQVADSASPHFETDESMTCGLRMSAGGHVLEWSVNDYIDTIEETMTGIIDEQFRAQGDEGEKAEEKNAEGEAAEGDKTEASSESSDGEMESK